MNRPMSVDCSSSPNNKMYDTHQECQAWNPKCTVISSFNPIGCELKKANCFEYIRQRNCKKIFQGKYCYWSDAEQQCFDEFDDNYFYQRIYGDLTHQDCENFLSKCTINNIVSDCQSLSNYCDYALEQQYVITLSQQPCRWDLINQRCKDVTCRENLTAQTEAECLNFRKFNECQLKMQSNGTYGVGCELRPISCGTITNLQYMQINSYIINFNVKFYELNYFEITLPSDQCDSIQDSKSNEVCQIYNRSCILQSGGNGCQTMNSCQYSSNNICRREIMQFNRKSRYNDSCQSDTYCSNNNAQYFCNGLATSLGQLCYTYTFCLDSKCIYYCYLQTASKNISFDSITSFQDKNQVCQNYSSNYRYDNCNCYLSMSGQELCNKSVVNSQQCGYNFSHNTCKSRKFEHLTYSNYSVITDKICNDWRYDCILDTIGCTTLTGNCTLIKLIHQFYQYQYSWQAGKCVNVIDCQINATAITNYECLLENADYCRLNYTKGIGCTFYDCSSIQNQMICILKFGYNQSNLADGQNCIWINDKCHFKLCSDFPTQFDCENSHVRVGRPQQQINVFGVNIKLQNVLITNFVVQMSDCNNRLFTTTILFQTDHKCIKKQQLCSDYTYIDACVKQAFGNIRMKNTSLIGGNFVRCNLNGIEFENVDISGVNFNGAQMLNCKWKNIKVHELNRLDGHSSCVRSVCFSPDGNTLASGGYDNSIRLWGQQKAKLDGHTHYVMSVCFSPDGNTLASGSYDNSIHLWDVKNKYCSDYRFKEIQVKSTRYPFYPFAIHQIQWFTQTSILYRFERVFYKKPFPFRRIIGVTLDQFKNQPILTLNLNLFQYTSCLQYLLIEFYFIVFFFFNNLEALLKWNKIL